MLNDILSQLMSSLEVVCAEKGNYHGVLHDKDTNKWYGYSDSEFTQNLTC